MFTHPIPRPGRRRALDRQKKQLVVNAVSRGATMTEAAIAVGVSLRTVQREARQDSDFDQELRLAHADKAHPLDLMESAARTHWRAAAWLLERTNPEQYGRRSALSCTPFQFEEALKVVVEAALRLAPQENRAKVYAKLTEAGETAFKAVFPTCGPGSRRLVERLPKTPLVDEQSLEALRNTPPEVLPDLCAPEPPAGWLERAEAAQREANPHPAPYRKPRTRPEDRPPSQPAVAAPSKPPALPGDASPRRATVQAGQETPGQRPGLQTGEQRAAVPCAEAAEVNRRAATDRDEPDQQRPTPAPQSAANLPTPTPTRLPSPTPSPETPTPASRLSWRYLLRAARTNPTAPVAPSSITNPSILSHLSPKTRVATEFQLNDKNPTKPCPTTESIAGESAENGRNCL